VISGTVKVADVVRELKSFSLNVDITDPHADSDELMHEYGFSLSKNLANDYDAVLITVPTTTIKCWMTPILQGFRNQLQ
jgi:UDP-N-acetyl-D-galactosamine dehydrogenase